MYKKNLLSNALISIAIIIVAWSLLGWVAIFMKGSEYGSSEFVSSVAYLDRVDRLLPNLDNDKDGPYVLATIVMPMFAVIMTGFNWWLSKKSKEQTQTAKYLLICTLIVLALSVLMNGIR